MKTSRSVVGAISTASLVFGAGCSAVDSEAAAEGSVDEIVGGVGPAMLLDVLDADVPFYATFQSHNPKVYCHGARCFVAHLEHRSDPSDTRPDVFDIRIQTSADSGLSFSSLALDQNQQARPPSVLGDDAGNVFVLYPDNVWDTGGAVNFLRYSSDNGYSAPLANVTFPQGGSGKFTAVYDAWRKVIYYANHNNSWGGNVSPNLFVLDTSGVVLAAIPFTSAESMADPLRIRGNHYPHLTMVGSTLVAAWTSTSQFAPDVEGLTPYESIHALRSEDGGASWQTLSGVPLTTPVLSSLAGPATRIVTDDEANTSAHKWLSSVIGFGGSLHFSYSTRPSPARQHYVRVDAATGAFTANVYPTWAGETTRIHSLDGVFVDGGARLYAVGADNTAGQLVVLASHDSGASWHDHAAAPVGPAGCIAYSIDAHRRTLANGSIVGVFTRQCPGAPHALVRFVVP